ncbi:MAG: hypothetical protein RLZZ511_3381 [Cyanobacteriota bacterium]|jgi:hypothetical protein
MADKSDKSVDSGTTKPAKPTEAKPAVLPDLANYVVPSVEVLLISGFGVILLNYTLGWGLFSRDQQAVASQTQLQAASQQTTNNPAGRSTGPIVQASETDVATDSAFVTEARQSPLTGTHRVICNRGDQGLNFRPSAGFSTPSFAIPCGAIVAVTGNAVTVQNETWSPVSYGGRSGWSASKLLQPLQ